MITEALPAATILLEAPRQTVNVDREEALADIHNQLVRGGRFVALRGGNGSGKSHFLKHQLLPYYENPQAKDEDPKNEEWRVAFLNPQVNPIGALATALAGPGVLRASREPQPNYRSRLATQLRDDPDGLVSVYNNAAVQEGKSFRLLIVVDQLEEMFRIEDDLLSAEGGKIGKANAFPRQGDDAIFFNLFLRALRAEVPIFVIFSIGTDSLDRLNAFPGWPEKTSLHRFALPGISTELMKEALNIRTQPGPTPAGIAELYDLIFKEYVTLREKTDLGSDTADDEAAARINIALELLHQQASQDLPPENETVDPTTAKTFYNNLIAYYRKIGGLNGAPAFFFDKVFEKLPAEDRLPAERLFRAITHKDPSPDRMVDDYPVSWSYLREVCFRDEQPEVPTHSTAHREEQNFRLRRIIETFNFTDRPLPDLIRVIDPQAEPDPFRTGINDRTIVKMGGTGLIQEWPRLAQWVELEYAASALYRKLVDDAKDHFEQDFKSTGEAVTEITPHAYRDPDEPSMVQDVWNSLTAFAVSTWEPPEKEEAAESATEQTLMSEGAVELVEKRWLTPMKPNAAWCEKYHTAEVVPLAEEETSPAFQKWIEDEDWKAFPLVLAFWKKSKVYHENKRKQEHYRNDRYVNSQRNIARAATYMLIVAIALAGYSFYLKRDAKNKENNLRLLDFVDNMAKAHVIPNDIYRDEKFGGIKQNINDSDEISSKAIVIDSLAGAGVLNFGHWPDQSVFRETSSRALLQLDALIDAYDDGKKSFEGITSAVLGNQAVAQIFNDSVSTKNYQFPYVYYALSENLEALKNKEGRSGGNAKGSHGQGKVYETHTRIDAVASNPKVPSQFVVGESTGAVTIFLDDGVEVPLASVQGGVSSLSYSRNGEQLYVSTFGGRLFRYDSLVSKLNLRAPLGRAERLEPQELLGSWVNRRSGGKAILSVQITAREDCLVLMGDENITLIQRGAAGRYNILDDFELASSLSSLIVLEGSPDGTIFAVGGSGASELIRFRPGSANRRPRITLERTVTHASLSVSTIAFQPPLASRGRAPEKQRVAFGTETGDIWLTEVGSFFASGAEQGRLQNELDTRNEQRKAEINPAQNYLKSSVTSLRFNSTGAGKEGNEQLIASSLDGTVWLFNLDVVPNEVNQFLDPGTDGGAYDHVRLFSKGWSVDNLCLVNSQRVVAVEHNILRAWHTNNEVLGSEVNVLQNELQNAKRDAER